jgi:outer membrane biosynthesis protein TonB
MSTRAGVEERLWAAGQVPAPEPGAAFAQALEDRLRAVAGLPLTDPVPPVPSSGRARRWGALGLAAGTAAAVVAGALVAVSSVGDSHEVRVAAATDALVVLPDGTVGAVDPGLVVPDGSRIVTLDEGRVVAGDVQLGPDREAVVDNGALRLTPTTAPPPPPVAQPQPRVTAPTSPPATAPPSPPAPQPEPQPVEPVKPQPVEPQPKPAAPPPDTKSPAATDPAPRVVDLKLEALYRDTTVKLRWSAYTGPGFAAYLVLRSDAPAEPRYPLDDQTTVVARITDPAQLQYFDSVREPAGRTYRVVAVDESRRLLGRSPAVTPRPAATTSTTAPTSSEPAAVPSNQTPR